MLQIYTNKFLNDNICRKKYIIFFQKKYLVSTC
jgi:hypothetical protein